MLFQPSDTLALTLVRRALLGAICLFTSCYQESEQGTTPAWYCNDVPHKATRTNLEASELLSSPV